MGRRERARVAANEQVRELIKKSSHTEAEIGFIKEAYTGHGGIGYSAGQFFTPDTVAEFMVQMMGIQAGSRVLEPSCGGGRLLEHLPAGCEVTGIELMREASQVASICYPQATILQGDALEQTFETPFDYVIGNPPFGLTVSNWTFTCGAKLKSESAFIEYGLSQLRDGGLLGYVVADSILSNTRERALRKWLTEEHRLRAIISLPAETFKAVGTTVKTSFLLIQKGKAEGDYPVFMGLAERVGWDSRLRPCANDLPGLVSAYLDSDASHLQQSEPAVVIEMPKMPIEIGRQDDGQLTLVM